MVNISFISKRRYHILIYTYIVENYAQHPIPLALIIHVLFRTAILVIDIRHIFKQFLLRSTRRTFRNTLNGLTLLKCCACPKPGRGFPTSYFVIFLMFNDLWREMVVRFIDIDGMVGHLYLSFHVETTNFTNI
jgi:hypothetical protein